MMWSEAKQQRLDTLRIHEAQDVLTNEERAELDALFAELDAAEATAMAPAFERMRQRQDTLRAEQESLQQEATALEHIVQEQARLLEEANSYLNGLRTKRTALAEEYRRISGRELTASH